MKTKKTTILLVDDHVLVRAGIKHLIEQVNGFTVTGEASHVAEAMIQLDRVSPDMVITDIDMGADSGLDLIDKVKAR
jgi:YesN/AraC family two-component response regulator